MVTQVVSESVLNFRKMRHDFSPAVLKEGKILFEKGGCLGAKIASYSAKQFVIEAKVTGHFQDTHGCSIEVDRLESEVTYSTCDCTQGVDCLHLACLLFYLEEHFHSMLLTHLGKMKSASSTVTDPEIGEVERRLKARARKEQERQLVADYSKAGEWMARTSLFRAADEKIETGELMILIGQLNAMNNRLTEIQLAVKLTGRPKPVLIQQPKAFLLALQQLEPLILGSQRVVLNDESFGEACAQLVDFFRREFEYHDKADKTLKAGFLSQGSVFSLLSIASTILKQPDKGRISLFLGAFDKPLQFSTKPVRPHFSVQMLQDPDRRLVIKPSFILPKGILPLGDVKLVLASPPGVLYEDTYYPLDPNFSLRQAVDLSEIDHYVVPEALFPTFVAYALPHLQKVGEVQLPEAFEQVRQALYLVDPIAVCQTDLHEGELSVELSFRYGNVDLPEVRKEHSVSEISALSEGTSVVPRNLMKELLLSQELLWGLTPDDKEGCYTTKSEKRIIDFVSETLPAMKGSVDWKPSDGMSRCFSFESSKICLNFSESGQHGVVKCRLQASGPLCGLDVTRVLDAARMRRSYIELGASEQCGFSKKLLILPQDEIEALSLVIEDFAIPSFQEREWTLPLWSVVGIEDGETIAEQVKISCSKGIKELQKTLTDPKIGTSTAIPVRFKGVLHPYQKEGIRWLRRLRDFGLGGILADDMGLGKTIQAICALSEIHHSGCRVPPSLIVCPTSLVDNWKEELHRFDPDLKVITFVGAPGERRKLLAQKNSVDVFVTSYGLIQRDLEHFEPLSFSYVILDEAQAIKNRETRNARSVKRLTADYRLVLTGTPIENSLEDLWSLFDYLMPGFLGSHDRFVQTYMRSAGKDTEKGFDILKKRVAPFVLRRMKQDVLDDLPSISHIVYHCYLHDEQQTMYQQAAKRAKEELLDLVERQGFEKARLHVLATLTRLKQICCHPSLVHTEEVTAVRSAKYEMLQDLLEILIGGGHKTVLFSQYTKMLGIIKEDLVQKNIPHLYLDGSTKNRLSIVKQFNEDPAIPIFLVSLRAGGNGLNLVGADSVIHYDMWWNPAVENQATDRVWRMGQKLKVSSYKLITKGTIEEKIIELQEKKKDLISGIVESDDDVLSKLTWEDVLGLLKT
jgi:superfamily II DNA or RNA helicase